MAREYWVETLPNGQHRFVRTDSHSHRPHLHRSNTHDGSQSSRSRRVDFVDVTRKEYTALLAREQSLLATNEELSRENFALKANWQTYDDELRRLQDRVPFLETSVRSLEHENARLRSGLEGESHHHHHHGQSRSREREDEMRRLRNRNTRLHNENDALRERVRSLERDVRDGMGGGIIGSGARRLMEEVAYWKGKVSRREDEAERLNHKLDAVLQRNKRLEWTNESLTRQERKWRQEVDRYEAILRRHGLFR